MESRPPDRTVYVVATTPEGTTEALLDAHQFAAGDRIVLLVPISTEECRAAREFAAMIAGYAGLARAAGVHATPHACVCRRPQDVAAWFQVGRSTIVLGGRGGRWPLESSEERLAHALRREGHSVRFVGVPAKESGGASPDVA